MAISERISKIQLAFSKAAKDYDRFSQLHREVADELLAGIAAFPQTILDIGCGTGYLTTKLKERFAQSQIIGLDFAPGMLEVARLKNSKIDWLLADSCDLPFPSEKFDLVVSNLAYQWVEDLAQVFSEARRILSPGGIFTATLFGYHSCQELFDVLDQAGGLQVDRLPSVSQVNEALFNSGFEHPQVKTEIRRIDFSDMYELIAWLKSIGANNLSHEGFLGRGLLAKAAELYKEQFSYKEGIATSFEVISVYAKK